MQHQDKQISRDQGGVHPDHKSISAGVKRAKPRQTRQVRGATLHADTPPVNSERFGRPILSLGQTPPPFHGQAVVIQSVVDSQAGNPRFHHISMRFSHSVAENGVVGLRKIGHLFSVVFKALWIALKHRGQCVLYYPPAPGSWVPVVRDIAILGLLRPFCKKTIFHIHSHGLGQFLQARPWLRNLWIWKTPDVVVLQGDSSRNDAAQLNPRLTVIAPSGIDEQRHVQRKRESGRTRILFVGLHTPSKGTLDLLETAAKLKDLDIEFRLVGLFPTQQERDSFHQRARELKVDSRVQLAGRLTGDELWQEYADADIFFFPTYFEYETLGVVTIEAMSFGLPCVVSDWRGPVDIVRDDVNGFVCPTHDIDSYALALRRLCESSDRRQQMGQASYEIFQSTYTRQKFIDQLDDVFHSQCGAL